MIAVGNCLVSREVLEEEFVCNLSACKGACCVEGDAGAPLAAEEVNILQREYPKIKEYLRLEGQEAIEAQGTSVIDASDEEPVTPLVEGKECAYVIFDDKGMTKCGIEKAWENGATSFRKPISCHLYPIRIHTYDDFDAVNYHQWHICSAACELGKNLKVPVYRFASDALIRKYGPDWYVELEEVAQVWLNERSR
jgi:hypothetical protein